MKQDENHAVGFCKEDGCRCFATWPRGWKEAEPEFCEMHSPYADLQRKERAIQIERESKIELAALRKKGLI